MELLSKMNTSKKDPVHPAHYGGHDNPYEVAWQLGFCLGNAVKYISRAGKKGDRKEYLQKASWYLQKALWYLQREIKK